mmetsp:Transcript_13273/g.27517  ORF Transcript_13273/g.27517 Transcript_13273/m.27517 type:complete len:269 (+) Transcript_13273:112-918(+)
MAMGSAQSKAGNSNCLLLFLAAFMCVAGIPEPVSSAAWFITPPTQQQDWQQIASIVAKSWDSKEPCAASEKQPLQWLGPLTTMWNDARLEQQAYQRYVSTARRMRGTKYALLVAKEWGAVVGVIEMGIQQFNQSEASKVETSCPTINTGTQPLSSVATIGMVCVDGEYRGLGIAHELVNHCEEMAQHVWNETIICADVEPQNGAALRIFQSRGYQVVDDSVIVPVRHYGKLQRRQHIRLAKHFSPSKASAVVDDLSQTDLSQTKNSKI